MRLTSLIAGTLLGPWLLGLGAFGGGASEVIAQPAPAWARHVDESRCAARVHARLRAWQAGPEVRRAPPPGGSVRERYRIATQTRGEWIVVDVLLSGFPVLTRVSPKGVEQTVFGADCAPSTSTIAADADTSAPGVPPRFDDDDLRAALRGLGQNETVSRGTVFYIWSPHMPLSLVGYGALAEACRQLHLRLVPLLFPGADRGFAEREATRRGIGLDGLREATAIELRFRDALVHAPALIAYTRTRVSPVLPGYRDARGYRQFLEGFLAQDGSGR